MGRFFSIPDDPIVRSLERTGLPPRGEYIPADDEEEEEIEEEIEWEHDDYVFMAMAVRRALRGVNA